MMQANSAKLDTLNDYKRDREGEIMSIDGNPVMVASFGSKFKGSNPERYLIDGGLHIPLGFKAFVKWKSDEICLITRQSSEGIEYQLLYLPKSSSVEDFTQLGWYLDLPTAWLDLGKLVSSINRDSAAFFAKSPFAVFGITNLTIQSRIVSNTGTAVVSGVLRCSPDTSESSLSDYKAYLQFSDVNDSQFEWIPVCMRKESLPPFCSKHVSDSSVYFVDSRTGVSTWAHPWYGKYSAMLARARCTKGLGCDKLSIQIFQIKFLLETARDTIDTLDTLWEMARIFEVDLLADPFLACILRSELRYFASPNSVCDERSVLDLQHQLDQKRMDITNLRRSVELQTKESKLHCSECETAVASMHCWDCPDFFCGSCFGKTHGSGSRQLYHTRTEVDLSPCVDCALVALFACVDCGDNVCESCFEKNHKKGGRRNHVPVISKRPPPTLQDKSAARNKYLLEKAESSWVRFADQDGVSMYTNLHTRESRRDLPLTLLND